MKSTDAIFQWQDYVVFSVMLAISSAIGLYFGISAKRKKKTTADEMLTGSRSLPLFPVIMSLSASFTSATTILGIPAEVYSRGGEQWLWGFGFAPCFLLIAVFIVPVFHKLQLTNAYEYFELRFNKAIRYLGSLTFCITILLYMAAVLYAPAVALSQVTGISKEVSIIVMGVVCTFYTAIGGIRAVVWTDAFQLFVVWAGLLALMLKGAEDAGGWETVWDMARNGSRLPRFEMDPDPTIRHTFWNFLIGGGLSMMTVYGSFQINLQRYSNVETLRKAQIAVLLNFPIWIVYLTILCLLGLVMYAYFSCDPLAAKEVKSPDQLLPFFVLQTFGSMPGLPGLFVASLFSASISTLSSGINSMAAITIEDLIKPWFKHREPRPIVLTFATMILVCIFGLATVGLAYAVGNLGKTAFMIAFSVFGMLGGPLLGTILNGILVPFMNSVGAISGMLVSLGVTFYYGIYPIIHPIPKNSLPSRRENCTAVVNSATTLVSNVANSTHTMHASVTDILTKGAEHPYISYLHLSTVGVVVAIIVGILVSLLSGCNKNREVDQRTYFHCPCFRHRQNSHSFEMDGIETKKNNNFGDIDMNVLDASHVSPHSNKMYPEIRDSGKDNLAYITSKDE